MKTRCFVAALFAATALAAPAAGATLSDKRSGGDYAAWDYSNIFTKANACGCDPGYSVALVDTFTLGTRSRINGVAADLIGFDFTYDDLPPTFTGFDAVQEYRVSIFSSAAKAGESLNGDIYSTSLAASDVAFVLNGFTAPDMEGINHVVSTAAATFAVDLTLDAGTYWLAVMAVNDPDDNGGIGVAMGGSGDAIWANPAGSWGLGPDNYIEYGTGAGYAVFGEAVPEPATWAMMLTGFGLIGSAARRRRGMGLAVSA